MLEMLIVNPPGDVRLSLANVQLENVNVGVHVGAGAITRLGFDCEWRGANVMSDSARAGMMRTRNVRIG